MHIPEHNTVLAGVEITFAGQQVKTKKTVVTPTLAHFKVRSKLANYVLAAIT